MANEQKPTEHTEGSAPEPKTDRPHTDLPPNREPYYEGYFGTDEEKGAVGEQDDGEVEGKEPEAPRR